MHDRFLSKFIYFLVTTLCIIHSICIIAKSENQSPDTSSTDSRKYPTSDTGNVNYLNDEAWRYHGSDPTIAIEKFHTSISLANKIGYKSGLIEAYIRLGILCQESGEYDSAIYFHLKCLKISESIKDNSGIFKSYENLGNDYSLMEDSTKAIWYFTKALDISKVANDTPDMGRAYIGLGNFYFGNGQTQQALSWYIKARDIFIKINDKQNLAHTYNNIGGVYYNDSNYKKAIVYFFKNAEIKKELNDISGLAYVYENIATSYITINKDSSLHYFNLSIDLANKVKNPAILKEIYFNMVTFYRSIGDYKKALDISDKYHAIKDSIFTISKTKAIANIQSKYDMGQKEQQITILTSEKKFSSLLRNFLLVALALIIAISLVIFNRYRFEHKVNKIIDAEKKRSDELLLNILPAETAEELKKYGKTTAKNYDEVSVLFADIKGFSDISRQMTAQNLVADLDQYFGAFDLITEKFGLEKIKTIGDAYLCAGGLPIPGKGTPEEVINAALEMQQYIYGLNPEKLTNGEPLFEVRIGIHTGPIVAGVVGIKKFAYDIWGDTVNTAARMEQYGEAGKVNISEETYQRVKDRFICTFRGNIEVKNKGVFAMYFVEGKKSQESGIRSQESAKA